MLISPFAYVNFADFWLADQLNSLAIALLDFHFLSCFYITNGNWLEADDTTQCMSGSLIVRPVVNCLPAWFRFAQCIRRYRDSKEAFPHLANAGKYSTTFLVVISNTMCAYRAGKLHAACISSSDKTEEYRVPFVPVEYQSRWENPWLWLWVISCVINSIYSLTWDLKMDWGLLDSNAGENRFLREEVVYSAAVNRLHILCFFLCSMFLTPHFLTGILLFCYYRGPYPKICMDC